MFWVWQEWRPISFAGNSSHFGFLVLNVHGWFFGVLSISISWLNEVAGVIIVSKVCGV